MTTVNPSQSKKVPATKTALVCKLLVRPRGATVPELMTSGPRFFGLKAPAPAKGGRDA